MWVTTNSQLNNVLLYKFLKWWLQLFKFESHHGLVFWVFFLLCISATYHKKLVRWRQTHKLLLEHCFRFGKLSFPSWKLLLNRYFFGKLLLPTQFHQNYSCILHCIPFTISLDMQPVPDLLLLLLNDCKFYLLSSKSLSNK